MGRYLRTKRLSLGVTPACISEKGNRDYDVRCLQLAPLRL